MHRTEGGIFDKLYGILYPGVLLLYHSIIASSLYLIFQFYIFLLFDVFLLFNTLTSSFLDKLINFIDYMYMVVMSSLA